MFDHGRDEKRERPAPAKFLRPASNAAFKRRLPCSPKMVDFRRTTPDDARLDAVVDEFYCVADQGRRRARRRCSPSTPSSLYHAQCTAPRNSLSALSRRLASASPGRRRARCAAWAAAGHAHVGGLACCAVVDAAGALLAAPALRHATRSSRPLLLLCIARRRTRAAAVVAQLAADRVAPTTVHAASGAELGAAVARAAPPPPPGPSCSSCPRSCPHLPYGGGRDAAERRTGNGHHHENGNGTTTKRQRRPHAQRGRLLPRRRCRSTALRAPRPASALLVQRRPGPARVAVALRRCRRTTACGEGS